jgi:hypothetical protein
MDSRTVSSLLSSAILVAWTDRKTAVLRTLTQNRRTISLELESLYILACLERFMVTLTKYDIVANQGKHSTNVQTLKVLYDS